MASKLQNIYELSEHVSRELSDYEHWTSFLKSAAWQYKYPFQDQLLIYAQRPDATACASIDVWNKRLKSWINRGSKGIALLREGDRGQYLDYVFDISDTHSLDNTKIKLWQYDSRFDEAIIETLENTFGELKSKDSITEAVISAAQNAVEDSKADYLSELKYEKQNSFLEDLDELNVEVEFQRTAETSIAYMVMQRLGVNPDEVFEREDFPHIMDFNTTSVISVLGNAVSSISEEALRSISETIRAEEREEIQNRKNFAENKNAVYNEIKEENTPTINNERTDNYDRDNIHGSERVSDTESDSTSYRGADRQIRTDEEKISQTEPTEPIQQPYDNGQDNGASAGGRADGNRADTVDSHENGTDRGRDRGTESEKSDDVDRTDEQSFTFGGGNRTAGGGLQLSLFDLIPTEEQQRETVQRAAQEIFGAAFSMPQQVIDEVLCDGTNDRNSVIEICIEFSKDKSLADKAQFLRNLYKSDGKGFILDGRKVSAWWNEQGIRISYGDSANTNTAQLLSWEDAAKRIDELLDLGRFAPKDTLLQMDKYEYKKAANTFWYMERDLNFDEYPELRNMFKDEWFKGGFPDSTERIAEHLKTAKGLYEIKTITQKLSDMYAENNRITRFRYSNPNIVNDMLADLYITRKDFPAQALTYTPPERFISRDEVDKMFKRGSGISEGKYSIYLFFDTHSDKKERITFLKNHYGWGGSYTGSYNENHDAKGITFSHGDLSKPYAKIEIKWNEAEKHIDRLIKNRDYLSDAEIKNIPNYEQEQLILRIRQAYMFDTDENTVMTYPSDADYDTTKDILMQKLNDKTHTQTMLSDLKELLAQTPADARSYPLREAAIQDLGKYVNGEYNLFPHIDRIEEAAEETIETQLSKMTEEDKQEIVDHVETSLDYGESYNLTEDDMAMYNAITAERAENELETAKSLINDFCINEYGDTADFSDLSKIGIAYTTVTDNEIPIQVNVDLLKYNIKTYINEVLVDTAQYNSLSALITNGLEGLNFDDLVSVTDEQLAMAAEEKSEQTFDEYLAELHKDDNGSQTVALLPLGDFYEAYNEDAENIARELDIALAPKIIDDKRYIISGFPKHALEEYVDTLTYKGYDVVIADENKKSYRILSADKAIPEQEQAAEIVSEQAEQTAESLVGKELTIDDRKFVVDSINTDFNSASLRDITFQNSTGFPIFRSESIYFVKGIVAEQEKPQITAEFQKAKPQKVQNTVVYPEIPVSERHNFQISNDELGYGTPKEKFRRNVEAVNLLHELEFDHRLATPEEQEILSQYVGWGGLADAFDETKSNWADEYKELIVTLSPDEYEQARASTLTAHFTPPVVIKAMYKALSNMGFTQGNILEPSCGIGNFMGLMPDSMRESKMYGVELDSITGRIAQQLYQKNSVAIQGFGDSALPDSFFDIAIGNPAVIYGLTA